MIKFLLLTFFVVDVTSTPMTENRALSDWPLDSCVMPGTVALTFDDGPSGDFANILSILKRNEVRATFFVLGRKLKNNVRLSQRAAREGHNIASHTYSHRDLSSLSRIGKEHLICGKTRKLASRSKNCL